MKKNLIMGAVSGYSFDLIQPFIISLKKTEYDGDVCLFASALADKTINYLKLLDVQVVELPEEEYFSGMAISITRFMLYQSFLTRMAADYEGVMLTDVRDVVFQRDPFDFDFSGKVCCFLEDDSKWIQDCPMNSEWLRIKFGSQVLAGIGQNRISCVGTIIGSVPQVLGYLQVMLDYLKPPFSIPGDDTAIHNYLIYTGKVDGLSLFSNENGPVMTLGYKNHQSIQCNSDGLVLNGAGDIVNTLHQYDRHPLLAERLSFLFD